METRNLKPIIKISDLIKNYGEVPAVNKISFNVNQGEMFGLVGPDGAGKTSTIRILCGLSNAKSGNVIMLDHDIKKDKKFIQRKIGYLSQRFSLYGDLTIDENIEFFANIHDVKDFQQRRNELLDFTRLAPFRDRLADNLSGGMKQKLALACALIHKPQILFLDEPTTGVDPVSRRDFWKILSSLLKDGITIFMSTPYLDEAERCHRVAMMNKGEIIAIDSPKNIKASIKKEVIEFVCNPVRAAYTAITNNSNFEAQLFGDRINVVVDSYEKDIKTIEKLFKESSVEVSDSRVITPSLENVFMYFIKEAN